MKPYKEKGKHLEQVMFIDPYYIEWMLSLTNPNDALVFYTGEVWKLMAIFDNKSYIKKCNKCTSLANRYSLIIGSRSIMYWCNECDYTNTGGEPNSIICIKTYFETLRFIKKNTPGRKSDFKAIITNIAKAKGLNKVTDKLCCLDFFGRN